ncbi:MAG: type II secretion system F family protein [Nanoarchaeota archaeon]|nr:type II secretion system F family protein [Nanoarchaeota archaeon]
MEIKKIHWTGMVISLIIMFSSLFLIETTFFFLVLGIGIVIGTLPFVVSIIYETRISTEKEEMFLEFTRNLVESVKTGTPISKSIINVKSKSYGVLSGNIRKLANQIEFGIPLSMAFQVFSNDISNKSISRALTLIGQAEKAGGEIGTILESVAEAVTISDKLKKERKATISSLVVQGYIIFFIFIIIILVMQFKILPMIAGIAEVGANLEGQGTGFLNIGGGETISQKEISGAFLYLLLIQGFFSGLTIGKLSEGHLKPGIKHSFTLMLASFLVSAGANIILS